EVMAEFVTDHHREAVLGDFGPARESAKHVDSPTRRFVLDGEGVHRWVTPDFDGLKLDATGARDRLIVADNVVDDLAELLTRQVRSFVFIVEQMKIVWFGKALERF